MAFLDIFYNTMLPEVKRYRIMDKKKPQRNLGYYCGTEDIGEFEELWYTSFMCLSVFVCFLLHL